MDTKSECSERGLEKNDKETNRKAWSKSGFPFSCAFFCARVSGFPRIKSKKKRRLVQISRPKSPIKTIPSQNIILHTDGENHALKFKESMMARKKPCFGPGAFLYSETGYAHIIAIAKKTIWNRNK